jgi:hypothetical protein
MNFIPCAAGPRAAAPGSPVLAAGTQCSEARKKFSIAPATCIQMVYVDFMPENEKVRLRKEKFSLNSRSGSAVPMILQK